MTGTNFCVTARRGNKHRLSSSPALQKKTLCNQVLTLRRTPWWSRWTSDVYARDIPMHARVSSGRSIEGGGAIAPPPEWSLKSFLVTSFPNLPIPGSHKFFPNYKFITPGLFSTLRRVKTWLRSRMSEGQLTGLALLHIHWDQWLNYSKVGSGTVHFLPSLSSPPLLSPALPYPPLEVGPLISS